MEARFSDGDDDGDVEFVEWFALLGEYRLSVEIAKRENDQNDRKRKQI